MSSFSRVLPFKNPALWKGVGLGLGVCPLLLAVLVPNLLRSRMAANSGYSYYSMNRLSGGGGGSVGMQDVLASLEPASVDADGPKIIHKAKLDLLVANCRDTQKKIEALAASESGFLESSTLEENSAQITMRVPSARFDAVRGKLRDLATRVRKDSVAAVDVSKQYVDREARLRNLRAEEQQFLEIMKKAHSVPDVLAVTKELSDVRGEIERADVEFRHLKDQIDMAEIDVNLNAQVSVAVHWALGSSFKSAWDSCLESLADFADFLIWLLVNMPLLALWAVTIFFLAAACWWVLRKAARAMRSMFGKRTPAPESQPGPAKG